MLNSLDQLRNEEQLLLKLCRLEFTDKQKAKIGELMETVYDWQYFVRLSNAHGVIALCWHNIIATGNLMLIPKEQLETFHQAYLKSLTRDIKIYDLLEEVLDLSEEAGIKVVLLKGLALEKNIYGNKGLRQMNDLDLLVKREDAIRFRKLLFKSGFLSDPLCSPLHEKYLPNYGKHLPEMYKNGLTVEIHFNLLDRNGEVFTKNLIKNSILKLDGRKYAFYPPDIYHFLFLVSHLHKHEINGTSQLRLYTDLLLLLSAYRAEILNKRLYEYAVSLGLTLALREKLFILITFLEQALPDLTESNVSDIDKETFTLKFLGFLRDPGFTRYVFRQENPFEPLRNITGLKSKILFITGSIFPSLTFMKWRYNTGNRAEAILYYPVRLLKIAGLLFRQG
jgi:hypothetical protein